MIETFEQRIENHQAMVISIASKIHKRLPRFITYDDVLSCGQIGLAQAARTYQPQPEAKFSTYAYYRIRGAIFDGISRMNWTTRAEYRRYKALQMANSAVEATTTDDDSSDPEKNAGWFVDTVENLSTVYLFSAADTENPIENQLVGNDDDPGERAETRELSEKLMSAIATLSNEEQQLIQLTYFQNLSLAEAAKKLNKSRSWGSRTHAKVLKTLGGQLMGSEVES
ncbi:MAG: sigma-70 family RNA polymerase sigma factor [Mariniblastus sp.]